MKILYIRLTNFNGVAAAMKLRTLELDFTNIDKPIIQIFGENRCGKSVLMGELNPFSAINYDGDERNELPSIIKGETGEKAITYEVNGNIYEICHTYKPTTKSHTVYSSIKENGVELNPSGGVNTFNNIIERVLGINRYIFQFIINGTQLTSFGKLSTTQRKNRLNKSLGIDIYDKMHKMSTDDYRYTNKIIQTLNSTKEFLISTYGTYENLSSLLDNTQREYDDITKQMEETKSRLDKLTGVIASLKSQQIESELFDVERQIDAYNKVIESVGEFNGFEYDKLINEQITQNQKLSDVKSQRLLVLKDIDVLYSKKSEIESVIIQNKRIENDYNNMLKLIESLKLQIESIDVSVETSASSEKYRSLISHGQTINSICKEIKTTLNQNHLELFYNMIQKGIDISLYLIKENTSIMETEKEMVILSKLHQIIQSGNGTKHDLDSCNNCIYKNSYELMESYFNSMKSTTSEKLTAFDISSMEHAFKNVQTIQRLVVIDVPVELRDMFNITNIMKNLCENQFGIDISRITELMEAAAKLERRNQLIHELNDANIAFESMKNVSALTTSDATIESIDLSISEKKKEIESFDEECKTIQTLIDEIDSKRLQLSSIQNVDINQLKKRQTKLSKLHNEMNLTSQEYSSLLMVMNQLTSKHDYIKSCLEKLQHDFTQFNDNEKEISKHMKDNDLYKIISDSTSSTKGKPVESISSTVNSALILTNKLLHIMYGDEIELLKPTINESQFKLPFRVGTNVNDDIRYGSQSEQALLSMALSMSLGSYLTKYNVFLIDEVDAYMDYSAASAFILMIVEIMTTFKMEQLFVISHHTTPDKDPHNIHALNLSEEIEKQRI